MELKRGVREVREVALYGLNRFWLELKPVSIDLTVARKPRLNRFWLELKLRKKPPTPGIAESLNRFWLELKREEGRD